MNTDQNTLELIDLGAASIETQGSVGLPQETAGLQPIGLSDAD